MSTSDNPASILAIIAPGIAWDPLEFQDGNSTVTTRELHRLVRRSIFSKIGNCFKSIAAKVVVVAKNVGNKIETTAKKVGTTLENAAKTGFNFAKNVVKSVIDHVFVSPCRLH